VKKDYPDFASAEKFIVSLLEEKLSPLLTYHNKEHTLDVLKIALEIAEAEDIALENRKLLRIAVLFHDAGFIYVYKHHEEKSCEMAREYLPGFGFDRKQISIICEMIMATRFPHFPMSLLDQIIVDADLDYLGREDVWKIAESLLVELKAHQFITNDKDWIPYQIKFLKEHNYFTKYSKKRRGPFKELYLRELTDKLQYPK
jgi:uncharacterized protein